MGIPGFHIPRTLPENLDSLLASSGIHVTKRSLQPPSPGMLGFELVCTSADGQASVIIELSEGHEDVVCCIAGGPGWFDGGAYRELLRRIEKVLRAHGGIAVGEEVP